MFKIGHGYDVHKLVDGRKLILCGVDIPFEKGLLGHSDADVASHAIMDAILGAMGLYDIGHHFPPTSDTYKDACSINLMEIVGDMMRNTGFSLENMDVTIVAERPRLSPYRDEMAQNVAKAMHCTRAQINIKATTTEGLSFEGSGEGISATAVCLLKECRKPKKAL